MAEKTFETQYFGTIIVRNAMFESENGTDLFEGIELKDEMGNLVEVEGYGILMKCQLMRLREYLVNISKINLEL